MASIQVGGVRFVIAITNQSSPSSPDQAVLRQVAAELTRRVADDTWDDFTVAGGTFLVTVRSSPADPSQDALIEMAAEFGRRVQPVTPGSSAGDAEPVYAPVSAAALIAVLRDLGVGPERRTDTAAIAESIRELFAASPDGEVVNVDRAAALVLADEVAARESVAPLQIAAELSRLIESTVE